MDKICVAEENGTCRTSDVSSYSDILIEILKTAHPTLQQAACEVSRYEISTKSKEGKEFDGWIIYSGNSIGLRAYLFDPIENEGFDDLLFDAFTNSESSSSLLIESGDPELLSLRWTLYHELAHWLEHRFVPGYAFSCSYFEEVPDILHRAGKCVENCEIQLNQAEQAEAIRALGKSSHVSFYSLTDPSEDFAELFALELLLRVEKSHAYYDNNGIVLYNVRHGMNSPRFRHKRQVVNALLNPPFDDEDGEDLLDYEWATCTGRFAKPPFN